MPGLVGGFGNKNYILTKNLTSTITKNINSSSIIKLKSSN